MGTNSTGCTEWERDFDPETEQPQAKPLRVKPLETCLPGGTRSEYFDRLQQADAVSDTQQLVARIKRNSKYYGQTKHGAWFVVRVVPDMGYDLRGNNNNYRFGDVVFGIRLENGMVVELK